MKRSFKVFQIKRLKMKGLLERIKKGGILGKGKSKLACVCLKVFFLFSFQFSVFFLQFANLH
jgi:hypothetical protein